MADIERLAPPERVDDTGELPQELLDQFPDGEIPPELLEQFEEFERQMEQQGGAGLP